MSSVEKKRTTTTTGWPSPFLALLLTLLFVFVTSAPTAISAGGDTARSGKWVTRGFDAFRRGTFGNGGHNLFVSREGVLQRIHHFDFNRDGYVDLVFCNSQGFWEAPPAYVYTDPCNNKNRVEIPAEGALSGTIADFNNDGFDDLVIGANYGGIAKALNSLVYYGSPEGLTERFCLHLPTPGCTSVAAGDFNGDKRPDLVAMVTGKARVFYQTEFGLEAKRFTDLDIAAGQIAAADLDRDGFADLYVLTKGAAPRVFWGGAEGISESKYAAVPVEDESQLTVGKDTKRLYELERLPAASPMAKIVRVNGALHLFVPLKDHAHLIPVDAQRGFGTPLVFDCPLAISVDTGDINSDDKADLVIIARDRKDKTTRAWIYWGDVDGFDKSRRTPLAATHACDVAVGDINADECDDVVICQNHSNTSYSLNSLLFRGSRDGVMPEPVLLPSENAHSALIARTSANQRPQVIFVNRKSGGIQGDVDTVVYFGGHNGFSPDNRHKLNTLGAAHAISCDVNDDGYADLIVANSHENAPHLNPGTYCFMGGPKGFPYEPSIILPTKHAWGLATGDVDRDGFLDLVVSAFNVPDLLLFHGTADSFNKDHPQRIHMSHDGKTYDRTFCNCLADMNNDGWLDLLVPQTAGDRCFLLWGGPNGFDFERRQTFSTIKASCPQAVDLDGNGYLDLLIGGHKPGIAGPRDGFLYIYWNGPEGLREDRRQQLPADTVLCIAPADYNNDGRLDLFLGSYSDGKRRDLDSFLYWAGPAGAFSKKNYTPIRTHACAGCLAADFNEDGYVDLAVCNHKMLGNHNCESFVYLNGPKGFGCRPAVRLPTTGAHGMIPVQPGNIRDRGPEEFYVSEPFQLAKGALATRIEWEAELPPKTWVRARLRFSGSKEGLEKTSWQGPDGKESWFKDGDVVGEIAQSGRWMQYQLALGAVNSGNTPRVREIRVLYRQIDNIND